MREAELVQNANNADKEDVGNRKKLENLKDNIDKILNGTPEEKKALEQKFFYLTETPQYMKAEDIGLSGEYFSVRYGVVSRHKKKDTDHSLSMQNWIDLCDAIARPFAIAEYGAGFRLYTDIKINEKYIVVGVDVKGFGIEVNTITTAFGKGNPVQYKKIHKSKNITSEQEALLKGPNSSSYQPAQEAKLSGQPT